MSAVVAVTLAYVLIVGDSVLVGPVSVPRIAVWKSTKLPDEALPMVQTWGEIRIVTDAMCEALARRYNCSVGYARKDIMNIMRADACRYMALYEYGGIYADLDVTLKRPFEPCTGFCLGLEDNNAKLANYVMSARKRDPCLRRMVRTCCRRLESVKMDFRTSPHLVHRTCGPDALTQICSGCATVQSYSQLQEHVTHHVASATWKNNYPSWAVERMKRAGWSHIYEH